MRECTKQKRDYIFDVREFLNANRPRCELLKQRKTRVPAQEISRDASELAEPTQRHGVMNFRIARTGPRLTTHHTTPRRAPQSQIPKQTSKSGERIAWHTKLPRQHIP